MTQITFFYHSFFQKGEQHRTMMKTSAGMRSMGIFQHLILMVKWLQVDQYSIFLIEHKKENVNIIFIFLFLLSAGTDSRPASELLVEQRHMQLLEHIHKLEEKIDRMAPPPEQST